MTVTDAVTPSANTPPSRRRWLIALLSIVAATILLVLAGFHGYSQRPGTALETALADAYHRDANWRLEDLEAARAVVPAERNGAVTVMAAKELMPQRWPDWDCPPPGEDSLTSQRRTALQEAFWELEPQRQLHPVQMVALRRELTRAAAALAKARTLVNQTEGRYPIKYSDDYVTTLILHAPDARSIAYLLGFEVMRQAQDNRADEAMATCRAMVNAARSIGDEPTLVSQLVRMACRMAGVTGLERVLGQGQPSEAELAHMQHLLEKEESEPTLLFGMRGERAGHDRLMESLQSGKVSLRHLLASTRESEDGFPMELLGTYWPAWLAVERTQMLRYMNQAVELAALPPEELLPRYRALEETARTQRWLVRLFLPALKKMATAYVRDRAQLRCAFVAVAAERYRQAQGQWPDDISTLKNAGYLNQVPTDPWDGQRLRLRRLDDGLVIYSVGPDGVDNGGNIDRKKPMEDGTDVGLRLWDAGKRRQPARPLKDAPALGQ